MKTALFIVALAVAFPLAAQEKKPAAKVEKTVKKASPAKRQQDARHCLDQASNTAIIRCAEAYL